MILQRVLPVAMWDSPLRMQRKDRLPAQRLRVRHTIRLMRNRRARPLHNLLPRLHRAVAPIAQQNHHHDDDCVRHRGVALLDDQ